MIHEPIDLIIQKDAPKEIKNYLSGKYLYTVNLHADDKISIQLLSSSIIIEFDKLVKFVADNFDAYEKFGYDIYDIIDVYVMTSLSMSLDDLTSTIYNIQNWPLVQ